MDFRKTELSSLDLRAIWIFAGTGSLPTSPAQYPAERAAYLRTVAADFEALDVYAGDVPAAGDLLVHRIPWESFGQVFLVKDYDPVKLQAHVIELLMDEGSLAERTLPLTLDPPESRLRVLRPGLFLLRMKNDALKYNEMKTVSPAARGARPVALATLPKLSARNDFKTAAEALNYFLSRNHAGFTWAGMTSFERALLTTWKVSPQRETFWLVSSYEVSPAQPDIPDPDVAAFEVKYTLSGLGDAFGRIQKPLIKPDMRLFFRLRKQAGTWKIEKPEATRFSPVILESAYRQGQTLFVPIERSGTQKPQQTP